MNPYTMGLEHLVKFLVADPEVPLTYHNSKFSYITRCGDTLLYLRSILSVSYPIDTRRSDLCYVLHIYGVDDLPNLSRIFFCITTNTIISINLQDIERVDAEIQHYAGTSYGIEFLDIQSFLGYYHTNIGELRVSLKLINTMRKLKYMLYPCKNTSTTSDSRVGMSDSRSKKNMSSNLPKVDQPKIRDLTHNVNFPSLQRGNILLYSHDSGYHPRISKAKFSMSDDVFDVYYSFWYTSPSSSNPKLLVFLMNGLVCCVTDIKRVDDDLPQVDSELRFDDPSLADSMDILSETSSDLSKSKKYREIFILARNILVAL
jgi:hypothetical protein